LKYMRIQLLSSKHHSAQEQHTVISIRTEHTQAHIHRYYIISFKHYNQF